MKRRHVAAVVVLLAVLAPLVGLIVVELRLRERLSQRPEVGTVFPALRRGPDERSQAAPAGQRRVVIFAKAGCGNCDRTISILARLTVHESFDLTAVVVGSAVPGTEDGAFKVIPDPDGILSKRFGVTKVPLVFILDGESRVQATVMGERPAAVWRDVLNGRDNAL